MNAKFATRIFILVVMVILPLAWTGYMQTVDPDATISQQIYDMCMHSGPKGLAIAFLFGFVNGHFFFSGSYEKCKKCGN